MLFRIVLNSVKLACIVTVTSLWAACDQPVDSCCLDTETLIDSDQVDLPGVQFGYAPEVVHVYSMVESEWEFLRVELYEYNEQGFLASYRRCLDVAGEDCELIELFEYDSEAQLISNHSYIKGSSGEVEWYDTWEVEYHYGLRTKMVHSSIWGQTGPETTEQAHYLCYDDRGHLAEWAYYVEDVGQEYRCNEENDFWGSIIRERYYFDSIGQLERFKGDFQGYGSSWSALYEYDIDGWLELRVVSYQNGDMWEDYVYDTSGRVMYRESEGHTKEYVYDLRGRIAEAYEEYPYSYPPEKYKYVYQHTEKGNSHLHQLGYGAFCGRFGSMQPIMQCLLDEYGQGNVNLYRQ